MAIATGGYSVTNGDGLALRNGRLYVVRNQDNLVAVFNLGSDLLSAALVGEITSPGNLDVPTTATFALGKLWVVNARFNTPPTPTTPYWITRLPTSP
jgi:DNA-binding beta-propeller fold protein YncE